MAPARVDPMTMIPGDRTTVHPKAFAEMRAVHSPIVRTHDYAFLVLVGLSALHIAGVLHMEFARRSNLVSAMITGRKRLRGTAVDPK